MLIAYRGFSQRQPDTRDREKRDEQSQAEVDIVQCPLAGRLREMDSVAAEEAIKGLLAMQNEIGDGTMEESHDQSEHQAREVGYQGHAWSLATCLLVSIGGRT